MTFYCKPPTGNVGLDVVRRATVVRMQFLTEVLNCGKQLEKFKTLLARPRFSQNANYLMEGTSLDCMSYFLLSLLTAGRGETSVFVHKGECQLFEFRLQLISDNEFYKSVRKTANFVDNHSVELSDREIYEIFKYLKRFGYKRLSECFKNQPSSDLTVELPFTCVLKLVSERKVNLNKGAALVPINYLNNVLAYIFEKFLIRNHKNLLKLQSDLLLIDLRLNKLSEELRGLVPLPVFVEPKFRQNYVLTAENVDKFAPLFPPCMLNIHKQLRRKHRLKHQARIQYTLFLKEIGTPLSESIKFWSNEYSKETNNCCNGVKTCCHDWNRDSKRYLYNLRHLYGLEGAKRNYSSHCCKALQTKIVSFGDDSGCPFRHFDENNLRKFLAAEYSLLDWRIWKEIEDSISKNSYSKACSTVLQHYIRMKNNVPAAEFSSQPAYQCEKMEIDQRVCSFSQPISFVEPFFCVKICYDHEFCDDYDENNEISTVTVRKPSEFYKIVLSII